MTMTQVEDFIGGKYFFRFPFDDSSNFYLTYLTFFISYFEDNLVVDNYWSGNGLKFFRRVFLPGAIWQKHNAT